MSLEIYKTLVISTAHIRESDAEILQNTDVPITYELEEYGWLIYTDLQFIEEINLAKEGFSNAFQSAIKLAQNNDCLWLRLDRDGPEADELPTFDW